MAATALDVLSLARLKHELRIEEDEDSQDTLLTGQIMASVSHVEQSITVPLLDRTETLYILRPSHERPTFLRATYIKQVSAVRYWTSDGELRSDPDGVIEVENLGRQRSEHVNATPYGLRHHVALGRWVWPPDGGWPESLSGSCFEFDITRGLNITAVEEGLVQAVILCCRQLYDGREEIKPTTAYKQFIKPWKSMSP